MLNFVVAVAALAIVIAVPIVFAFYVFKIRRIAFKLQEVLWGIIGCFFMQTVFFNIVIALAMQAGFLQDTTSQQLIYWSVGAISFFGCYMVFYKLIFKGQLSEGRISRVAFGAILIKTAYDCLGAAWSNVVVAWHIMNGTLSEFLEEYATSADIDIASFESFYQSYGPSNYVHTAAMALLFAFASYLLLLQLAESKHIAVQIGYVVMFSFLYYYTLILPVPLVLTISTLVFSGVQLISIRDIIVHQRVIEPEQVLLE